MTKELLVTEEVAEEIFNRCNIISLAASFSLEKTSEDPSNKSVSFAFYQAMCAAGKFPDGTSLFDIPTFSREGAVEKILNITVNFIQDGNRDKDDCIKFLTFSFEFVQLILTQDASGVFWFFA